MRVLRRLWRAIHTPEIGLGQIDVNRRSREVIVEHQVSHKIVLHLDVATKRSTLSVDATIVIYPEWQVWVILITTSPERNSFATASSTSSNFSSSTVHEIDFIICQEVDFGFISKDEVRCNEIELGVCTGPLGLYSTPTLTLFCVRGVTVPVDTILDDYVKEHGVLSSCRT